MAYLYPNLLFGSWDLSTALWFGKATRSDKTFWGAAVADCNTGGNTGGIYFPNDANMADARATSGAEYVLSFFARADVAGDKIHSDVWGSKYMLDTELTTEWQQVVMPYGIVNAYHREIFIYGLGTNSGTVHVALPMCVRGTEPAAWAPADGETLAGGGALMSANLLDGVKPEITQYGSMADGVITSTPLKYAWHDVARWPITTETFAKNQTMHLGISAKWHGKAATTGVAYAAVKYADAAGSINNADIQISGITTEWQRFSLSAVIPSGMHIVDFHISADHIDAAYDATNPVLSYGSAPLTLASAEHTHQVPYVPVLYTYEADVPSKVELTYTDASFHDVGLIEPYDGDFAYGNSENDFSIDTTGDSIPEVGAMMYAEGSDVGGIVTGYSSDAAMGTFSVVGDTWTGVLDRRVVGPDSGSDYLTLSGDVRDIVAALVSRAGLTGLFRVAEGRTGITASHTFTGSTSSEQQDAGRYMGTWSAIWQVCVDHGCKCRFAWSDVERRVIVTVARLADYTDDEAQSAGLATVGVSIRKPTNHLVCLGKGDLKAREVLHLYADRSGNVSTSQTIKGVDEIAEVYDDSSAEGDKLRTDGTKKLRELWQDSQEVTVKSGTTSADFDLGDVIGGTDPWSGLTARAIVTKKVASFKQGTLTYTYTSTVRSK